MINEKFLIRIRDCILKLPEIHPLKKWMKWIGEPRKVSRSQQKKEQILSEIVTSQFNLITDIKTKNEIIGVIRDIPENTLSEELLKSYLYLMIGNVTRSDNILRKIINKPPRNNWTRSLRKTSSYHKLAKDHLSFIFKKLSKHPADRKSFELLSLYFQHFFNDSFLIKLSQDVSTDDVEGSLELQYIKLLAPEFVSYLRLSRMKETQRLSALRSEDPLSYFNQAYWIWTFYDIDALISEKMTPTLKTLERQDELWFIYLMQNERLFDLYSKNSEAGSLAGRRKFLREKLSDEESFMLSLYKLIELGDINNDLVNFTMNFLIND